MSDKMNQQNQLDLKTSVAELIKDRPEVIPVFLRHRMACVGCSMSMFETLGDAARIYGIAPEVFVRELEDTLRL